MRLINTTTLEIKEFVSDNVPPYAILSDTWETGECSQQDMLRGPVVSKKLGDRKIKNFCDQAAEDGME
jgi:hypothetical protein